MRQRISRRIGATIARWAPERAYAFHYERVLGTSFELRVRATSERVARGAEMVVLAEVDRLAAVLNAWSATSELSCWSATSGVAVPVSSALADVLHLGDVWQSRTGGALNPAAQAIIAAIRDDGDGAAEPLDQLVTRLQSPCWTVDREAGTATKHTADRISVDAIAKGYIVAHAAAVAMTVDGVRDVLLNIGGDIQHLGAHHVAIGVADPFAPAENAHPVGVVHLRNRALATSGGYRRGFTHGGRHVSHIVDPRTGRPADQVASASVFAPDCATADALSTAFSVLAPVESIALADALPGVGCLLVAHDGTVTANRSWQAAARSPSDTTTNQRT